MMHIRPAAAAALIWLAFAAPSAAARHLLDTLVLPLWDRTLLPGALDFVHRLVAEVPVLAFTYPPTIDAVTWMLEELRRGLDE